MRKRRSRHRAHFYPSTKRTVWVRTNVYFGPSFDTLGIIWESFLLLRPLPNPIVTTFGRLIKNICNLEQICHEILLHLGCNFRTKADKSHKRTEKIGARKASRKKIDCRSLPKWPDVVKTHKKPYVWRGPPMSI